MIRSMTTPDHIVLADGRRLDIRISGPERGLPLVFHHGTPGSLSPTRAMERAIHQRGLRLLATSRPGYGGSSRLAGRTVSDVVADTEAALEAIDADHCLVAGWSGGGPHALACAARLPAALSVLVIAGVAPYEADGLNWMAGMGEDNIAEFGAALRGEEVIRAFLDEARPQLQHVEVEGIVSSLESLLPDVDKAVLTDEFGEDMAASFHEALSSGVDGWVDDDLAFIGPWGFELDEITVPTSLWQGSDDLMVPFAHGQWLASHVPSANVHLVDGEGHLSIALGAMDQMLDELTRAAGAD